MRYLLFGLILVVVLTATFWQPKTLIWFDNWLASVPPSQQPPKPAPNLDLTLHDFAARRPGDVYTIPDVRGDQRSITERAADAIKRQAKILENDYFAAQLKTDHGGGVEYSLPQSNIAGGEVRGRIDRDSATVELHWPRKD